VVTTTPPNQLPNTVTFHFGTLTNPNNDQTCETMIITFNALVLNDSVVNPDQSVKPYQ